MGNCHEQSNNLVSQLKKNTFIVQCKTQQEIDPRMEGGTTTNIKLNGKKTLLFTPVHRNKSEWLDGRLLILGCKC